MLDSKNLKIPDRIKKRFNNGKSDWIGRVNGDTTPILYMSSTLSTDTVPDELFHKMTGVRYRCFSYAYCGFDTELAQARHIQALEACNKLGIRVFMDSGAHSFHKMLHRGSTLTKSVSKSERLKLIEKITEQFLQNYARYMRWYIGEGRQVDWYATLDAQRNCPLIYEITSRMFNEMGLHPVPVYHGDHSLDWVKRYIDEGHKLIALGIDKRGKNTADAVRRYYSSVFELTERHGVSCHGFAVTGDMMFEFPWYSVDSTTWLKAAAYGKIIDIIPERQRVALIHISDQYSDRSPFGTVEGLAPSVARYLRDKIEKRGFDWERTRKEFELRAMYNARIMVEAIEEHTRRKQGWKTWKTLV